jgi:general secretion pathway protein F
MAVFRYAAFAETGDVVSGTIDAASQAQALKAIHERGMLPFEAVETEVRATSVGAIRGWRSSGLPLAGRAALTRDLAILLKAEVTLDHSLRILGQNAGKSRIRRVVQHCAERVAAGQRLSDALKSGNGGFSGDELAMLAAGEQNGSLAQVLDQLAKLLERRLELGHRITSALIYPALLLAMAVVSIFVIITVLIPNIEPLFEGKDAQMPVVVAGLLETQRMLASNWQLILFTLLACAAAIAGALRRVEVRRGLDRTKLRLPVVGRVISQAVVSRTCLTLATLLESGVPLQQSLGAAANVAGNFAAREIVAQVSEEVITGRRLSQALAGNGLFDDPSLRLIALGEETNRLHQMLHHIAATTEAHVVRQVERAMTLLTPVLTLALGVAVGGIIMSVMQAILSINEMAIR